MKKTAKNMTRDEYRLTCRHKDPNNSNRCMIREGPITDKCYFEVWGIPQKQHCGRMKYYDRIHNI